MSSLCCLCCVCWWPAYIMGSCVFCCKRRPPANGAKRLKEVNEMPQVDKNDIQGRYNPPPPRPEPIVTPVPPEQMTEEQDPYIPLIEVVFSPSKVKPAPVILEDYENQDLWRNPYNRDEFVTYIKQQLRGRVPGLSKEFKGLDPMNYRYVSDDAKSMSSRKKNSEATFIPYDMSRIRLKAEDDYINASLIPGVYRGEQKYIVAQCPIVTAQASTLGDFWQMVWEENIRCIVSLTPDGDGEKGAYWPKGRSTEQQFGSGINVKLSAKSSSDLSTQRTFIVGVEEDKRKSFILHQIEVSSELLQNKKSPSLNLILLSLVQQISDIVCSKDSSAKLCFVSRNNNSIIGLLMGLFELMKPIKEGGTFSVFQTLNSMLDHRAGLITEYAHYQLLFIVVLDLIQELKPISLQGLREVQVGVINPDSDEGSEVITEYNKVDLFCTKAFLLKSHKLADACPNKGQQTNVFPYDDNMVALQECPSGCNYIDASLIHMESGTCPIIAAAHPVKNTLPEFIWMLMKNEVQLVVVLAKQQEIDFMMNGTVKSVSYWAPTVFEKSFGNFNVLGHKPVEEGGMLKYSVRATYVEGAMHKRVHRFKVCLFRYWGKNDLPEDNAKCLQLLQFIQEYREGREGNKPVVLQSLDGSTKIGVLLAVMNGCVQIQGGEEVDVPWVVKKLRCQRMNLISSKEEYQKTYELLKEFLSK